jgi:hypothetical protein
MKIKKAADSAAFFYFLLKFRTLNSHFSYRSKYENPPAFKLSPPIHMIET